MITELITDAESKDSHGENNAKSFQTLTINSELRNNLELFENDKKVRDMENNPEQVMGEMNKLSQQICCSNVLTSERG